MTSGTRVQGLALPAALVVLAALATWAYLSDLTGIGSWTALAAVGVGAALLRHLRRAG